MNAFFYIGQPKGVNFNDRWREIGQFYEQAHKEWFGNNFFFDLHVLLGLLFGGGNVDLAESLLASAYPTSSSAEEDSSRKVSWNRRQYWDFGRGVWNGVKLYASGDYASAVDALAPLRGKFSQMSASHGQTELITLVMLRAGVLAGPNRRHLTNQLLEEHMKRKCGNVEKRLSQLIL